MAAIRVRRGDELELVVDTELPDEVGSRIPLQLMLDELAVAEDWGLLQFVPHERGSTGPDGAGWVIPEIEMLDDPDAWHPMDMLVAPLYDEHGELRGTFAIDLPLDGRRPDAERRGCWSGSPSWPPGPCCPPWSASPWPSRWRWPTP